MVPELHGNPQACREQHKDMSALRAENADLKLEVLKWRKRVSIFRLRVASTEEDARMCQQNLQVVAQQLDSALQHKQALEEQVVQLQSQLQATEAGRQTEHEGLSKRQVCLGHHARWAVQGYAKLCWACWLLMGKLATLLVP